MRAVYHHGDFNAEWVAKERDFTVSVCYPARNEAATIAHAVAPAVALRARGVVDQVLVVDDSTDGTMGLAAAAGAEVVSQSNLPPGTRMLGKGDAMWRALYAMYGDVIIYLDADTAEIGEHYIVGLLGPLVANEADFVKGFYERPFLHADGTVDPHGGGRLTEILAKPLLRRYFWDLRAVLQPLAGEIAARRWVLEACDFIVDYGVDIALLIDAYRLVGGPRIAQVDLDVRQNRHRPLTELGDMADQVLAAAMSRARIAPVREIMQRSRCES